MTTTPTSHDDFASDRDRADARLSEALASSGAPDPRAPCRAWLRELREKDPAAGERALEHYERRLVPAVAGGEAEPLQAWLRFSRMLASELAGGRSVALDASGRAEPCADPVPGDRLVLHLPDDERARAMAVGIPGELTPPQRAALDLLVHGRQKMEDGADGGAPVDGRPITRGGER